MSLLAKAERYCSNEEQCRTSVRKKLCDWGASLDVSGRIVERLCSQGYIDERRYAKTYCESKLRNQKWGRLKVIYQLRSKQIPPKFITEGMTAVGEEEYRAILQGVAEQKWSTYNAGEDLARKKAKLNTFLSSRGYEMQEIQGVLQQFGE